ncbi:MAG: hypothetical protein ACR2PO_01295 [Methyloligellaceae bacterium]
MRTLIAAVLAVLLLGLPQTAFAQRKSAFSTPERIVGWMYAYRAKPQVWRVPAAVRAMKSHGLFTTQEKSSLFVGFIAGVLGDNPRGARTLVAKMFPMSHKEQAVIIRAIAYSGHPRWQDLLLDVSARMPERKALIDKFLSGDEKTLMEMPLKANVDGLYVHWGYHLATGDHEPVQRVISALEWCKDKGRRGLSWRRVKAVFTWSSEDDEVANMTVCSTAKWTLASYAERDRALLKLYRGELDRQPDKVVAALEDVIQAADTFESERIRKQQLAAIEKARQRALARDAQGSKAAAAGSIGIATTCVIAGATGHPEISVPCVIVGALYSGAVKMFRMSR